MRANYDPGMFRELTEKDADAVVALYRVAFGDTRPIDAAEIASSRLPRRAKSADPRAW